MSWLLTSSLWRPTCQTFSLQHGLQPQQLPKGILRLPLATSSVKVQPGELPCAGEPSLRDKEAVMVSQMQELGKPYLSGRW